MGYSLMFRQMNGGNYTTMNSNPFFSDQCILSYVVRDKKRRLVWAGHAWRKHDSPIGKVIEEKPVGRRPLGRPWLRWEDCVKRDAEAVEPNSHWQEIAEDRDRW